MPTLLSPLVELLTIEEDISCDRAITDLLDKLASLGDLFPIIKEVPSSTAPPIPSTLFTVEEPVGPSQDQTSKETPVRVINDSFVRPQWSIPRVVEEPLAKRTSYDPSSDDEEEEIPEGLTSSTHPFYRGHQYPPPPPLVPPEDVKLPPSLPSTSSTSSSSMAAVVPPPTPKEKGRHPDPFTQKSGYEKFCQQLSLFF
ncbi:hypothetical protein PILCRDRAFT_15650 [Piloderma croceum F 1598]|uniref:Uncharacterized protein n=1 Tax=Piloderma croceum (strain F 1598) TaxID=765440 RepID=A0A0C3EYB1_PILCF|nr:hypothetical protein PILCRDRAFT_15650 [Piloderma croceum F 1598]